MDPWAIATSGGQPSDRPALQRPSGSNGAELDEDSPAC